MAAAAAGVRSAARALLHGQRFALTTHMTLKSNAASKTLRTSGCIGCAARLQRVAAQRVACLCWLAGAMCKIPVCKS